MLERFTDPARQMILTAQEEARLLQHDYVGTEHLLIAATEVDDGLTVALAALGITTEAVRGNVTRMVAPAGREQAGEMPLTTEAKAALERSLREALQLGHGGIRPEHIMLGLLDVHDGTMPVLLARLGVRNDVVRAAVLPLFDARPTEVLDDGVAPSCGRCGAVLDPGIRLATTVVDGVPLRLAYCGSCGTVLPVGWGS